MNEDPARRSKHGVDLVFPRGDVSEPADVSSECPRLEPMHGNQRLIGDTGNGGNSKEDKGMKIIAVNYTPDTK